MKSVYCSTGSYFIVPYRSNLIGVLGTYWALSAHEIFPPPERYAKRRNRYQPQKRLVLKQRPHDESCDLRHYRYHVHYDFHEALGLSRVARQQPEDGRDDAQAIGDHGALHYVELRQHFEYQNRHSDRMKGLRHEYLKTEQTNVSSFQLLATASVLPETLAENKLN